MEALEQASSKADTAWEEPDALRWQRVQPVRALSGTSACGPNGAYSAAVALRETDGVAPIDCDALGSGLAVHVSVRGGVRVLLGERVDRLVAAAVCDCVVDADVEGGAGDGSGIAVGAANHTRSTSHGT